MGEKMKFEEGYYPIFGITTVIMGWVMGMSMGITFMEMSMKNTAWSTFFTFPMMALWAFLLIRDETVYKRK